MTWRDSHILSPAYDKLICLSLKFWCYIQCAVVLLFHKFSRHEPSIDRCGGFPVVAMYPIVFFLFLVTRRAGLENPVILLTTSCRDVMDAYCVVTDDVSLL